MFQYTFLLETISKYTNLQNIYDIEDDVLDKIMENIIKNDKIVSSDVQCEVQCEVQCVNNYKNNKLSLYIKKNYNCSRVIKDLILNGSETITIIKDNIIYTIDLYDYEIAFTNTNNNKCIMYSIINDLINDNIDDTCIVLPNKK
jgi:hypothetical protein